MSKFKSGDKVRVLTEWGYYVCGEVTIAGEGKSKVIFGDGIDAYDYWPNDELELITEEDVNE